MPRLRPSADGLVGMTLKQDRVAGIGAIAGLETVHAGWARPAGWSAGHEAVGARHFLSLVTFHRNELSTYNCSSSYL